MIPDSVLIIALLLPASLIVCRIFRAADRALDKHLNDGVFSPLPDTSLEFARQQDGAW